VSGANASPTGRSNQGILVQATKRFLDQHHPVCAYQRSFAAFS